MVIIWAGIRDGPQFDNFSRGMGARTCRLLCPAGKSADIRGDLTASKEQVWLQSLLVPEYPGAGDANDRCIIACHGMGLGFSICINAAINGYLELTTLGLSKIPRHLDVES